MQAALEAEITEFPAAAAISGPRPARAPARAHGRVGGRKPKLTARQAEVARGMYDETGADERRKYIVAEIAETFGVSRKTIYRHLEPSGGRRQPGKTTPPLRDARHEHPPPPALNTAAAALSRPASNKIVSINLPQEPLPRDAATGLLLLGVRTRVGPRPGGHIWQAINLRAFEDANPMPLSGDATRRPRLRVIDGQRNP